MHIVNITSEMASIAKVGGLGDVVLGLSMELAKQKQNIEVIIPKYKTTDTSLLKNLKVIIPDMPSYYNGEWYGNSIWQASLGKIKITLIEHNKYFERDAIYGYSDDVERFTYFSRAALEYLKTSGAKPDVLHIHDWETAVAAPLCREIYHEFFSPKILLSIHNVKYQGHCHRSHLDAVGLPSDKYFQPDALQNFNDHNCANLLKGGIIFSDHITTVSPNYAWEITTLEGGFGLDGIFKEYQDKFCGILNGIDYDFWNPAKDQWLDSHYTIRDVTKRNKDMPTFPKKIANQEYIRDKLSLEHGHRPIIGAITRLVPQKAPDLIKHALYYALKHNGQFILLGSSPIPEINRDFQHLQEEFRDHPHIHIDLSINEPLAHLIYAASDMFIVPSLFEPCGLTPMIASRYATIPIVRRTGGLIDSVSDDFNGFTFFDPTIESFDKVLNRAFNTWFNNPQQWKEMIINGMKIDFSWKSAAKQYLAIMK